MVYVGDKNTVSNNTYAYSQPLNNSNTYYVNKNQNRTDSVSFSGHSKKDKNKIKIIGYILGGLALVAGVILLFLKLKKGGKKISENTFNDVNRGIENLGKEDFEVAGSDVPSIINQNTATKASDVIIVNDTIIDQQNTIISVQNQNLAEQEATISELKKKSEELGKKIEQLDNKSQTFQPSSSIPGHTKDKRIEEPVKETSVDDMLNNALNMYTEELCKTPELKDKKGLVREILPELKRISKLNPDIINGIDDEREILKVITPENKDFIIKQALPKILERVKDLNININASKYVSELLETLTPEALYKVDTLADIIKGFGAHGTADTVDLFEVFKNDHNNFIFEQVLSHFTNNFDKYGISRGSDLASLLKIVTPQNKDFMFNEALPTILKNAEKLDASGSEIAEIAEELTPGNLKNIQIIADNLDKFDIRDKSGFILDMNKMRPLLRKDSNELLK